MNKAKHKYVIQFQNGLDQPNAVAKAPDDISYFLEKDGYERIDVATMGEGTTFFLKYFLVNFLNIVCRVKNHSLVVVQYPVYSKKGSLVWHCVRMALKLKKKVHFALIIHDLRSLTGEEYSLNKEIMELNSYDYIVAHSKRMVDYLSRNGCKARCLQLGLFDYSASAAPTRTRTNSTCICFAGNLAKSLFLSHLDQLCVTGLSFSLYGSPQYKSSDTISYNGTFCPDAIPDLNGSWGLVWDGPSICELSGRAGVYQKYNSPHKASLYILAGLPLIVNVESAIAELVRREKLGICIDSLMNLHATITRITDDEYNEMISNVQNYSTKLKNGNSIRIALKQIFNG